MLAPMGEPPPDEPAPATIGDRLLRAHAASTRGAPLPYPQSPFERALFTGPEPRAALERAVQLPPSTLERADGPLAALLHQGGYLPRLIGLCPSAQLDDAAGVAPERAARRAQLRARIGRLEQDADLATAIARVRTEAYVRIGGREVAGAPLEEIGTELSALVEACTGAALASEGLEDEVVAFAMGKLAGDELNFLSDVDLVFAHHDPPPGESASTAHRRRTRRFARLRTVLRLLEGSGQWKPLFRLDLRLRPFGSRGPLALSATATERYYEQHGRQWERQVWLRARPMAGDLALGEAIQRRLEPFVHPRAVRGDVLREIGAVMRRGRRDARGRALTGGFDLKLDRGGIREIEFFVQALQLLHGGHDPTVRSPSTLGAIDRLAAAGHLSDREHRTLGDAYRWLRRVEHRVQLAEGQQTHRVPREADALAALGRRLVVTGHLASESNLSDEITRVTRSVCAVTATLDADVPAGVHETRSRRAWAHEVVLDPGAPPSTRRRALQELGLHDPAEASAVVEHLLRRRASPFADPSARRGAEALLLACLDAADPDGALVRLVAFCSLRPPHYAAWRWLGDPNHDEVIRRVADLFGASEPLSRGLIGFPNARGVADDGSLRLLAKATDPRLPPQSEIEALATERARDLTGPPLDRALLRLLSDQLVVIGLHDLAHRPDSVDLGRALSDVADAVVRRVAQDAVAQALHETATRAGPRGAAAALSLGVFAVGKFGDRAMDYGSDLDLLFVFDSADPRGAGPVATRAARAIRARLEGSTSADRLYSVDMRLRPSGQQGLLVTSRAGFASYHAREVPVWERIALCRLRPVVVIGDPSLGPSVADIVSASVFDRPTEPETIRTQVRHLRDRVHRELARETRTQWNAKTGRGGAFEVELLVGALQLLHPTPRVRAARGTLQGIAALTAEGVLSSADERALAASYRFLRHLLNRLRMRHGSHSAMDPDRFDVNSPRLSILARRMGLADRDTLVQTFEQHRDCIHEAFDRLL
jgi:glutamate-ammonia-ligase adenylyltransferase